jgi:hypothetical protein
MVSRKWIDTLVSVEETATQEVPKGLAVTPDPDNQATHKPPEVQA